MCGARWVLVGLGGVLMVGPARWSVRWLCRWQWRHVRPGARTNPCPSSACLPPLPLSAWQVEILNLVSPHRTVACLKGVHEDRAAVHIVMELCAGGELFQRIVSKGTFSEADAARHFRTMVEMVSGCLCHGQGGRQLACCVGGSGGPSGLRSCQPAACAAAQAACLNHLRCAQSAHPASHSQSTIANNKLLLRRWRTCTRWG